MIQRLMMILAATMALRLGSDDVRAGQIPIADARGGMDPASARPDGRGEPLSGLTLPRPYRRGRVPVVLIHGLGMSPACWGRMIAELEGDREIGGSCQFWTFSYETGGPLLYSAALLRGDLSRARRLYDPEGTDRAFDQMVLVGHSMGGLLARMMAQRTGSSIWEQVSERPFEHLAGPPEARDLLARMVFFEPERAVRRLVYIATPHRGHRLSGRVLPGLTTRLFPAPEPWARAYDALVAHNAPDFFRPWFRRGRPGSIQDLSWGHPVSSLLLETSVHPAVKAHSIIAQIAPAPRTMGTDGVVSYRSAHLDGVASERVVAGTHFCHDHPRVIEEVGRILREHLAEAGAAIGEVAVPAPPAPGATGGPSPAREAA